MKDNLKDRIERWMSGYDHNESYSGMETIAYYLIGDMSDTIARLEAERDAAQLQVSRLTDEGDDKTDEIVELEAERDALRAGLKRAHDHFRLALAILDEQRAKIETLREIVLREQSHDGGVEG